MWRWPCRLHRSGPIGLRYLSKGGDTPADGQFLWEWWLLLHVSDAISVTPAVFYLSRPLGQNTAAGESFSKLGALVKTTFRF